MADPRISTSIDGIGAVYATFKIDNSTITYAATSAGGSASVGLAVNLSADQTVQLVADNEVVLGKLIKVESDNIATVQVGGGVTLPAGTGATLTAGLKIVGCLLSSAKGYIRGATAVSGSFVQAEVVSAARARGFIANGAVTTAVEVWLP